MLRRNPHHKRRIPDGLAVVAAVLLGISTLAGMGSGFRTNDAAVVDSDLAGAVVESTQRADPTHAARSESAPGPTLKQSKRFKVNLFLFRR